MAINYASKFSKKVDERFFLKSLTSAIKGAQGYSWEGVSTVTVYTRPTQALVDYTLTGADRYGTPAELQNTKQDLTVTKDRSFSVTIDKKSNQDTMGVMEASKFLKDEMDEVITPEIDAHCFATMVTGAGNTTTPAAITANNAYDTVLALNELLDEDKVPQNGRILYALPSAINFLKKDSSFTLASDMAQDMLIKGQVGEIDGCKVVKVPSSYLPAAVEMILCTDKSLVTVMKLEDYKIHEDAPGISGQLVEGRVRYDAFVLTNKANSIAVHTNV